MAEGDTAAYDLVVLGAGPAGVTAAVRAARLGAKVACVEGSRDVGGCCANEGCVPTKSLCHSTHLLELVQDSARHGVRCTLVPDSPFDFAGMKARMSAATAKIQHDLLAELDRAGVHYLSGSTAHFAGPHEVELDNGTKLAAKSIVVATGGESLPLPGLPFDGRIVLTTTHCLELQSVPARVIIVGAGASGLELGLCLARLGSYVDLVEMLDHVGSPGCDAEIAGMYQGLLQAKHTNMAFHLGFKVQHTVVDRAAGTATVRIAGKDGLERQLVADKMIVCVGRQARTKALCLERAGVKVDARGALLVDDDCRSVSCPSVFAAGDCASGGGLVAHKATMEAATVAEVLFGHRPPAPAGSRATQHEMLPAVVYTKPELAWVGPTEEQLLKTGKELTVLRLRFNGSSRDTLCTEPLSGAVKLVAERGTGKLLAVCMVSDEAGDMISEAVLALRLGATVHDWGHVPHAHPFYKSLHTMLLLGVEGW